MTGKSIAAPVRRTQEERSASTRAALIDAAIKQISSHGYAAATTGAIADLAGMTRGAFLHHFGTRADLMAQVVADVFEREMEQYEAIVQARGADSRLAHWPQILWSVLSQPSGMAVLEILQAARSDQELAEKVGPMQRKVEDQALEQVQGGFGGDKSVARAVMRLMVGTVRGLTIAERIMPDSQATEAAITLLCRLLDLAAPDSRIDTLSRLLPSQPEDTGTPAGRSDG